MTNESVIPRAGPFILHHNGQVLLFAVLRGFWRHFKRGNGRFLDAADEFSSIDRMSFHYGTKKGE